MTDSEARLGTTVTHRRYVPYSHAHYGGNLVGRTDKHAGDVEETPISPKDVLATAFHLLGIDPESTFPDPVGRPLPFTGTGRLREELLG